MQLEIPSRQLSAISMNLLESRLIFCKRCGVDIESVSTGCGCNDIFNWVFLDYAEEFGLQMKNNFFINYDEDVVLFFDENSSLVCVY